MTSLRKYILIGAAALTVFGFGSSAAQDVDFELLERHMMSRFCNEALGTMPSASPEIIEAKAYWAKRASEITPDYEPVVQHGYTTTKPEIDALGLDELVATCANEMLLDEVRDINEATEQTMTESERVRLEKFEARMEDVQSRLEPLSQEAQISAKFSLLFTSVTLGAAETMSEDELFEYMPSFFEKLIAAMQIHSDTRPEFIKSKKDVKRLLEYNEYSMRSCQWSNEAAIHTALETKDFDLATDSLIRSALWQGLINFRREQGGQKSDKSEPSVIQKLYSSDALEKSDKLMIGVLQNGCALGLLQSKKIGKTIFGPFIGVPISAAKEIGETAGQGE